jgi:hypothetical protein
MEDLRVAGRATELDAASPGACSILKSRETNDPLKCGGGGSGAIL